MTFVDQRENTKRVQHWVLQTAEVRIWLFAKLPETVLHGDNQFLTICFVLDAPKI